VRAYLLQGSLGNLDHPFNDGNTRIGAFLFLLFFKENNLLGQSAINDNGLVALVLLIAGSDRRQMDLRPCLCQPCLFAQSNINFKAFPVWLTISLKKSVHGT